MTINLTSASITAGAAATQTRTLSAYLSDIVNVKNYGAVGDSVTDDTAAIQAAFNAAFGTWAAPHGSSTLSNKAVFFPNGTYKVSARSSAMVINDISSNGSGGIRLGFSANHGLSNGDVVYIRGVGGTTNANGSFSITEATSQSSAFTLNNITFNAAWTGGGTSREPCLRIHNVQGGRIFGAGKFATTINTASTNCALLSAFGLGYSHISDMAFNSEQGGIAFDCNGDGLGTDPISTQSDLFTNCQFGGSAASNGDYGCTIGMCQHMGSEITFLDCYIATGSIAGISWHNFNALSGTVVGGNFAIGGNPSTGVAGILVVAGACPVIHGVGFQNQQGVDVKVNNSAGDAYSVAGCRSESQNFVQGPGGTTDVAFDISGCYMTTASSSNPGFFYQGAGNVNIDACKAVAGHFIAGTNASVVVSNSAFTDTDYLSAGSENYNYLEVRPQPAVTITSTNSSIQSYYGGSKLLFNNASAMVCALTKNSDATNRLSTGTFIDVQRMGAGTVTFSSSLGVTINTASSKSLRSQFSCARLVCDNVADSWSIWGDLST